MPQNWHKLSFLIKRCLVVWGFKQHKCYKSQKKLKTQKVTQTIYQRNTTKSHFHSNKVLVIQSDSTTIVSYAVASVWF